MNRRSLLKCLPAGLAGFLVGKEVVFEEKYKKEIKNHITFSTKHQDDFIVLNGNGDFIVKGKLTTNDKELYKAVKEWAHMAISPDLYTS